MSSKPDNTADQSEGTPSTPKDKSVPKAVTEQPSPREIKIIDQNIKHRRRALEALSKK